MKFFNTIKNVIKNVFEIKIYEIEFYDNNNNLLDTIRLANMDIEEVLEFASERVNSIPEYKLYKIKELKEGVVYGKNT